MKEILWISAYFYRFWDRKEVLLVPNYVVVCFSRLNVLSMGVDWDSWGELGQMGRIGTPFLSSIRRDILFVFGIVPIPSACPNSPCLSQFTPVDSNS